MNRELLNVKFDKNIKLKKFKKADAPKPSRNDSITYKKTIRLVYFIVLVIASILLFKGGLELVFTLCTGQHYSLEQIYKEMKYDWNHQ
jgi:hypothetical protein